MRTFKLFANSRRRALEVAFVLVALFVATVPLGTVAITPSSAEVVAFAQEQDLDLSALDDVTPPAESNDPVVDSQSGSESASAPPASPSSSERARFLDLLLSSGWIGVVLLIASIVAVSLIIRLCLALRRSSFIPEELAKELRTRLVRHDVEGALKLAEGSNSFLGAVVAQGLREASRGWNAVEKALEDAAADYASKTFRRSEPLATIGNVAPMLGLLGTVIGMVTTFGEIAVSDGSGRNLANGIYFALVTTVDGLIVAIPALVAHSLINARIATLVSQGAEMINTLFEPLKAPGTSRARVGDDSEKFATRSNAVETPTTPGLREIPADRPAPTPDRLRQRPSLTLPTKRNDSE